MSIVKTVKALMQGFGHATTYVKREGVATAVGATAIRIPTTGSFAPTISNGKVRVKNATVGAASTSIITSITGSDGVTVVNLYGGDTAASAAGTGLDRIIHFMSDLNLTFITVTVTTAVADSTHDVEVAGNM